MRRLPGRAGNSLNASVTGTRNSSEPRRARSNAPTRPATKQGASKRLSGSPNSVSSAPRRQDSLGPAAPAPPAPKQVRQVQIKDDGRPSGAEIIEPYGSSVDEWKPLPTSSSVASSKEKRGSTSNIRVCIRVRPLSQCEVEQGQTEAIVKLGDQHGSLTLYTGSSSGAVQHISSGLSQASTSVQHTFSASSEKGPSSWSFDEVFEDATQSGVYSMLGEPIVQSVADGYHGCIFAYGQTGSGKSFTIFGGQDQQRGLVPRATEALFSELERSDSEFIVKFSYLEIYNEKVRDMLRPTTEPQVPLEIRQHPRVGVFVEGQSQNVVTNPQEVARLIDFGNKIRVVGRTNMNMTSSRSHAVVTWQVEQRVLPPGTTRAVRRRATLHAVDLAGSERMSDAGGYESRQKESSQINRSLTYLSLMISRLASQATGTATLHVPYRNSKLTFLLSDSLMGNCRTAMVACVSPASQHAAMTESTLRFAASAKNVKTKPVQNEELDGDLVSSLRAEIELLRMQLQTKGGDAKHQIAEKIRMTQCLTTQFSTTWEEQKEESRTMEGNRQQCLERLGLNVQNLESAWRMGKSMTGLMRGDADPYLINVCDDPLLSGCLVYPIPPKEVVTVGSDPDCHIHIDGLGVQPEMCHITSGDGLSVKVSMCANAFHARKTQAVSGECAAELAVSLEDDAASQKQAIKRKQSLFKTGIAQVYVNNNCIVKATPLKHGDHIRVGRAHVFQLCVPKAGPQESMKEIVDKLVPSDMSEKILFEEYARHLQRRIGEERAHRVFENLTALQPLVDEANDLTEELRGGEEDELLFKAHVLTDVKSTEEDPEVVIALRVTKAAQEIFFGRPVYLEDEPQVSNEIIWTVSKFQSRLEVMRELYEEVSERDDPWGAPGDPNPWADGQVICSPAEFAGEGNVPKSHRTGSADQEPDAEPTEIAVQKKCENMSALQAELDQAREQLTAVPALREELTQLHEEKDQLLTRVAPSQVELEQLHSEVERLKTQVEHLRSLEVEKTDLGNEMLRLQQDLASRDSQIEKMQTALSQRDAVISHLQQQLDEAPAQLQVVKRKNYELQGKLDKYEYTPESRPAVASEPIRQIHPSSSSANLGTKMPALSPGLENSRSLSLTALPRETLDTRSPAPPPPRAIRNADAQMPWAIARSSPSHTIVVRGSSAVRALSPSPATACSYAAPAMMNFGPVPSTLVSPVMQQVGTSASSFIAAPQIPAEPVITAVPNQVATVLPTTLWPVQPVPLRNGSSIEEMKGKVAWFESHAGHEISILRQEIQRLKDLCKALQCPVIQGSNA